MIVYNGLLKKMTMQRGGGGGGGCKILIPGCSIGKFVMMNGGVVLNSDPWKTSLEMNQSPGKLKFED